MTVAPPRPIRLRSARNTLQPARAASIAAYMPAPPDPMIRTSVSTCMGSARMPVIAMPGIIAAARSFDTNRSFFTTGGAEVSASAWPLTMDGTATHVIMTPIKDHAPQPE